MKKPSLVSIGSVSLVFAAFLGVSTLWAQGHVAGNTTFGKVLPLPGHINAVAIDEARGLVYAGNFSAGRVEVLSTATHQRVSSFSTTPQPAAMVGMDMSLDSRFLVTLNAPVTSGVSQLSGVTAVNLNDPADRRHYAMVQTPLAITFQSNGEAFIITTGGMVLFEPDDGSFRTLVDFEAIEGLAGGASISLPVPPPTFPRQVITATVDNNATGTWIFGATDTFVFSYQVGFPAGLMVIRTNDTLVNSPVFPQVSASEDGNYFMAGQLLFNRRLRVIADTPVAAGASDLLVGGSAIDSDINTVYVSFDGAAPKEPTNPGGPELGLLSLMDLDNLWLRTQYLLPEKISGPLAVDSTGDHIYALGQSGLIYLSADELANAPQMEFHPDDRRLFFQFDFCNRESQTQTLRLENPGGKPAQFTLSVDPQRSSGRPAVRFEPHTGVTPVDVRVTVDPGALGPVQGTHTFPINIETNAINVPRTGMILANIRDVDQKGILHVTPGRLVDIAADPFRDRFYALDQEGFQVLVFDADFRLSGKIRTGNTPTWMLPSRDGRFLVVANAQSETMTLIDLNTLQVNNTIFLNWEVMGGGRYPLSLAADNANILISTRGTSGGEIAMLNLSHKSVTNPDTLGIFNNSFDEDTALVAKPDGSGILIVEASGGVHFWETLSSRVTLSRNDLPGLSGALGAGLDFFLADNHVLNSSLVRIATLPGTEAGQESSGFTLTPDLRGVRSIRPRSAVDTGALQRLDPRDPTRLTNPVRMVEPPPDVSPFLRFSRTLTTLRDGRFASTSSAGVVEFPLAFDATLQIPRVASITNGADFSRNMGAGGLITIFGDNLATQTASAAGTPLPTSLANTCVTVNGGNLPLLFVSPEQINAQLPFVAGVSNMLVHNPGGLSNIFVSRVDPSAPAIFKVSGPNNNSFAAVFREDNKLATLSSPLRANEIAVIYATGLGPVSPIALPGYSAPESPLSIVTNQPAVTFGGVDGDILFAGLTPGFVGLYQINVRVPIGAPLGPEVPLEVSAGSLSSRVSVRIVE